MTLVWAEFWKRVQLDASVDRRVWLFPSSTMKIAFELM